MGRFDEYRAGVVYGWAADPDKAGARVRVRVLHRGQEVAAGEADRLRADLASGGLGDGRHAFEVAVPGGLAGDDITVVATLDGADLVLERANELERSVERVFDAYRLEIDRRFRVLVAEQAAARDKLRALPPADEVAALREAVDRLAAEGAALGRRLDELEVFVLRIDRQVAALTAAAAATRTGPGLLGRLLRSRTRPWSG